MLKGHSTSRNAFTLLEVMVAVMIVSVVIAALLQMQANTSKKLLGLKEMLYTNHYNSLLISNIGKYGFEDSKIDMLNLLDGFELESELRRKLKSINTEIFYEELETIDTSEMEETLEGEDEEITPTSGIVLEIGRTTMETEEFKGSLVRIRLQ